MILLDVLFSGGVSFRLLRDRDFRPQWNLRYSHGLSDDELRATLERFVAQGWLRYEPPDVRDRQSVYWMTPEGGALWEGERLPQWNHYADGHYARTHESRVIFVHCAFTKSTIDRFVEVGEAANLWGTRGTRYRRFTLTNYRLIRWKPPTNVHVCAVICCDRERHSVTDIDIKMSHEEKLSEILMAPVASWRNVGELQLFIP